MPNRLAEESSPYLQQHASNPVNWFPWGDEALTLAKQENKPILLSIGYSTCHWCHVMAHESFSDPSTAEIMNELFVNIKVDREERPDLDKIYQSAFQLLNRSAGGWPLTVFLNPQTLLPFYAGTYFPPQTRYQLPAFKDLLRQLAEFYQNNNETVARHSEELLAVLTKEAKITSRPSLTIEPIEQALKQIASEYDAVNGGFGSAPKFFHPGNFLLLLYYQKDLSLVLNSFKLMGCGGIYDQIGGGFFRYSVDKSWEIPHFEKMLYDNAQLLFLYTLLDIQQPQPFFKKIISETATWTLREMRGKEGAYYSAIDADSEGKEGRYYLWTPAQIKSAVTAEQYQSMLEVFNLKDSPNFEGYWHLHCSKPEDFSSRETFEDLSRIQDKLLPVRQQRIAPAKDKKVLTAWNALMLKALLLAGQHLQNSTWLKAAEDVLHFIYSTQYQHGRLLAVYKDQKSYVNAYLDDYVFLLDALLVYLQYKWHTPYWEFAQQLAEVLLNHFYDHEKAGFFFVSDDHEKLVFRPKSFMDEVIPSGNGLACFLLQRLGYLLGEKSYLLLAERTLHAALPHINYYPAGHTSLLMALEEYLSPPQIIILRGASQMIIEWQKALGFTLNRLVFAIVDTEKNLPPALAEKVAVAGKTIAYVCEGQKCLAPIDSLQELLRLTHQ